MRRTGATVAIALAILGVAAPPAAAHSTGGLDATNFDTRLTAVTPDVPGIEVEVIENGNRVEVTNTTDDDLVVLGYQGEPYLRIGPDGVFENVRSPATYLNQDRRATTPVPGTADPDAEPDWRRIDDGTVARWHDHRIHWMGEGDPPVVRRDPGRRHVVVPDWVIPMEHAGTTIEARGDLLWVPGPNPWPWIGLAAAFLVAVVVASRVATAWRPALAVALGLFVALDVAHAVGAGFAGVGSTGDKLADTLSGSYVSLAGWIAGVAGIVLLLRRREEGLYAAAFAGIFIAFNGGLIDITDLSRSYVPFAGPEALVRVAVASSLGLGVGLVVAAFIRLRSPVPATPPPR